MNPTDCADNVMDPNTGIGNLESTESAPVNGTAISNIFYACIVTIPIHLSSKACSHYKARENPGIFILILSMKTRNKIQHPHRSIDRRDFMKWMAVGTASMAKVATKATKVAPKAAKITTRSEQTRPQSCQSGCQSCPSGPQSSYSGPQSPK